MHPWKSATRRWCRLHRLRAGATGSLGHGRVQLCQCGLNVRVEVCVCVTGVGVEYVQVCGEGV